MGLVLSKVSVFKTKQGIHFPYFVYITLLTLSLFLFPAGINPKRQVQRTKTYQAGDNKYYRQNQQYNCQCARNHVCKIQANHNKGYQQSDNLVCISHVLFHHNKI